MKRKGVNRSNVKKYTEEGSDYIRAIIGGAVFELLKSNDYDAIKVTDIYRKAAVGKTTFYRYFANKDGKKDAMFFHLRESYQGYCEKHPELTSTDDRFYSYIWSEQENLRLLNRNNCLDVMDRLILFVYGPTDEDRDSIYFHYMGAGLWMGLMRAMITNDFSDSKESVKQQIAVGIMQLIQSNSKNIEL